MSIGLLTSGEALGHISSGGIEGGAFRIRARLPAGPDVTITVADTGDGIAADHLPHIFERFYRADPARDRAHGGSGIGLAIARALIAAHGSTLTAASGGPGPAPAPAPAPAPGSLSPCQARKPLMQTRHRPFPYADGAPTVVREIHQAERPSVHR
jgi:hypothetical protein